MFLLSARPCTSLQDLTRQSVQKNTPGIVASCSCEAGLWPLVRVHGKASVESTATVSADGKHLTLERKMLRIKRAPTDVLEFDR